MAEDSSADIDRRKSFRLDMEKEIVDISWIDESNKQRVKKTACLDFSRGGLRLDCDQLLPETTKIMVQFRSAENNSKKLYASVLRCEKQANGWYEIALLLDEDE